MRTYPTKEQKEFAIEVMAEAFKGWLVEHMGPIEDKSPIELAAWANALLELDKEIRQLLLQYQADGVE